MILKVGKIARSILGVAFAALLMLAAVTPAFAEVGCLEDRLEHSAEVSEPSFLEQITSAEPEGDEQKALPGQPAHCAFSHCGHAVPPLPLQGADQAAAFPSADYVALQERHVPTSNGDGPYHPPRA